MAAQQRVEEETERITYLFITERGRFNTSQSIHHIRERESEIFKTS
jgi:hypothetical protein